MASAPPQADPASKNLSPTKTTFTIGTRKSKLALVQTDLVRDALKAAWPQYEFNILTKDAAADLDKVTPLREFTSKNLWTEELEELLLAKQIDLVVHSLKGANDACILSSGPYVPLQEFEEHIRHYVNSILDHPGAQSTKVILITPPPVDVPSPGMDLAYDLPEVADAMQSIAKLSRGHKTWASKRAFAEKIVEIGKEFEAKTDRVAVLDFWTAVTKAACKEQGVSEEGFHELDVEDMLPGSGLPGAGEFGREFFIDGLHFGSKGYEILTRELFGLFLTKWPELEKQNFPLHVCAPFFQEICDVKA
ncbi:hypothetical protein ACJ72_00057 [Emergomyces africanus]|uniref:hydroxymethylbilane synthase n=1 Tax=Emergomyces africanus TaxID=1955775 RepID=A0A1B7P986_9EURO|nr:hypothetical protein ACJ72_00057 [Emergomyces africanus]